MVEGDSLEGASSPAKKLFTGGERVAATGLQKNKSIKFDSYPHNYKYNDIKLRRLIENNIQFCISVKYKQYSSIYSIFLCKK